MVVSTELYARAFFLGNAAAMSFTVDSPRAQRIFINLNSASVSVGDFLGGIEVSRNKAYREPFQMSTNQLIFRPRLLCSGEPTTSGGYVDRAHRPANPFKATHRRNHQSFRPLRQNG